MDQVIASKLLNDLPRAFAEGDVNATQKQAEMENVRRVQEVYRAIASGNYVAFMDFLSEDIELEIVGPPVIPIVGHWRGKQEVGEAVQQNFALLEDQKPEIQTVVAQGDTVILVGRETGRFRPTGLPYTVHWVQIFTLRNGKAIRFRELFDSAAMLEAVQPNG